MNTRQIQCFGCSLLCDDLYIEFDTNGILHTIVNSCFRGTRFIKNYLSDQRIRQSIQKQMGLDMLLSTEEAISILEQELLKAQSIKFYGIGAISYQDQLAVMQKIVELKKKNKTVYVDGIKEIFDFFILFQTTIGQAINNADLFLFWECDPTHSHPKLFGKLLFSRGMFRLSGKEMKKLIIVQKQDSDLTRLKDILIDRSSQTTSQIIKNFINLLENKSLDTITIGNLSRDNLRELKAFLEATEYGVLVCNTPLGDYFQPDELNRYLARLNASGKGRFVFLPLTPTSNYFGMYAAYTKIVGNYSESVTPLKDGYADLAIIFGGEYLRDEFSRHPLEIPEKKVILFDNLKSNYSNHARITIPYAIPGIECDGTAIRMDNVNVDLSLWNSPNENIYTIQKIFNKISL